MKGILIAIGLLLASSALAQDIETTGSHRLLSRANSRSVALGSDAVFIGTPIEAHVYGWATVTVTTDVPGTLFLEYGPNGTNWYSQAYPINEPLLQPRFKFSVAISGGFARTRFVNGPVPQGSLLIETIYHSDPPDPAANRFDHPAFGVFLQTATLIGRADVVPGLAQAIWPFANIEPDWSESGTVDIISTSVEDNPTGTGMGSVLIAGSDSVTENFLFEVLSLNGTTEVNSTGSYSNPLTIMTGISAGSGGSDLPNPIASVAQGVITATINGAESALIDPANGENASESVNVHISKSLLGLRTVFVLREILLSVGKTGTPATGTVSIEFWVKRAGPPPGLWNRFSPTEIQLTAEPSSTTILAPLVLNVGDFLMCIATTDKDVSVGLSAVARIFMPLATCTGDCS